MNLVVEEIPGTKVAVDTGSETVTCTTPAPAQPPSVAGSESAPQRPRVELPGPGREISEFAADVGRVMGPRRVWFVKGDQVVEIRQQQFSKTVRSVVFHMLTANETRTVIEQHLQTGHWRKSREGEEFVPQSMSAEMAAALLAAPQLRCELPVIERILDVPIPYLAEGELVFAARGYDERLNTYCPLDAPEIRPMSMQEANDILHELQHDFCFADGLSVTLSTARLLTPLCRGLMGWSSRPPVWVFEGNRARAGKDYLAGCTTVLYEGRANEDVPLETEGEETRKRILAALQSGRRFMHFANCQGYIHNAAFEHAATAKVFSARNLGRTDGASDVTLPNEIEFSLSANTGFSFTEDFNLRCRKISLHYAEEDANSRVFRYPDLHGWVLEHRSDLLSAMAALIRHWNAQGRPPGPTAFTSFPEWARVGGGIMVCCGLGDPCHAQLDSGLTGDTLSGDMKKLFQLAQDEFRDKPVSKQELYRLLSECTDQDLFVWWDLTDKSGQTAFGKKLKQFNRRILGGIQLIINDQDPKRPRYRFSPPVVLPAINATDQVFLSNRRPPEWEHREHWVPQTYNEVYYIPVAGGADVPDVAEVPKPAPSKDSVVVAEGVGALVGEQEPDNPVHTLPGAPLQQPAPSKKSRGRKEPGALEAMFGITPEKQREIIQAYGDQHQATEQNLEDQSKGRGSVPSSNKPASKQGIK
jgi:hypothetical protein